MTGRTFREPSGAGRSRSVIRHVVVVVPAHDEEDLVERCLGGLEGARSRAWAAGLTVDLVLVLDDCTDRTAQIASNCGVADLRVLPVEARSVGLARAAGVRSALVRVERPMSEVWVASTDADSRVSPDWIVGHVRHADHGADLVIGTVHPDLADLSEPQRRAWLATRTPGRANGHVHGANLGIRADAYLAAGGFGPESCHEDVNLVDRVRASAPERVLAVADVDVLTSGRLQGRTPGGYARYLREDLVSTAVQDQSGAVTPWI